MGLDPTLGVKVKKATGSGGLRTSEWRLVRVLGARRLG